MKKTFINLLLLSATLLFAAACNNNKPSGDEETDTETVDTTSNESNTNETPVNPNASVNDDKINAAGSKNDIEEKVAAVIKAANNNNVDAMCKLMVYRGKDEDRKWKTALKPSDSGDRSTAEVTAQVLTMWLDGSTGYTFGELKKETKPEGTWHNQQVNFKMSDGSQQLRTFMFLEVEGELLLGELK